MPKDAKISARILAKVAEGSTLQAAFDAVLGAGAYARLADDLHEALTKGA